MREDNNPNSGSGARFGDVVIILAGVAALSATFVTVLSVWLQTKNYRKPLLQRYVIRILLMVPIYSAASWASLKSLKVAFWVDPFRDIYEAFTLYTFTQLLVNFLGGERSLILMTHGRPPVSHLWPLNHCLPKIDISDPYTFLAIKRGILQYTWVKPILAVATIVMKATSTYQEGFLSLDSGYFWTGLVYNISICWSLYCLAVFWICMSDDLQPFRPMPKFLCIKGIIFASWWQGFFLSILVWLGAIPDNIPGYSPDNLASAIQDALICFEMPLFALAHWYAFSWHDYADSTISAARMPIRYALRDAFGPRDLIEDTKETLAGKNYDYRYFDAHDNVLAHEESRSRLARMREGMRYERDGKGKYWIPSPSQVDHRTPLLGNVTNSRARTMSPGKIIRHTNGSAYGTGTDEDEGLPMDAEDEHLYSNARALEFGDWNYPVITAHEARREHYLYENPRILTQSTNRNILQPTRENKRRRKSQIQSIQKSSDKGKHRRSESSSSQRQSSVLAQVPIVGPMLHRADSSSSGNTRNSQLVDLVIEDHDAEEVERVRARKEGGPAWNEVEQKHFVRAYPDDDQSEEIREGFEPDRALPQNPDKIHTPGSAFAIADDDDDDEEGEGERDGLLAADERTHWHRRDLNDGGSRSASKGKGKGRSPDYSAHEEQNPWRREDQ